MRPDRWSALAATLFGRRRPRATVLAYHRVAAPAIDPWSLAVTPEHFAEHVQVLARRATVVPLAALPSVLAGRRAPRRCVAVTFDDGYADNLHAAVPALERGGVPATVFVIAGTLGGTELWWDRLARLLLSSGALPERLSLALDGAPGETTFDTSGSSRLDVFMEIWRTLQPLRHAERERCLARIAASIGEDRGIAEARTLAVDELVALAAHPLVAVGGHTVTHPRLAALPPAEQALEIVEGKRVLEEIVGRPLDAFAYPFGRPEDFTSETERAVRDAGFRIACANFSGSVGASTDPHRLPRAYVQDCDGDVFEQRLAGWLAATPR